MFSGTLHKSCQPCPGVEIGYTPGVNHDLGVHISCDDCSQVSDCCPLGYLLNDLSPSEASYVGCDREHQMIKDLTRYIYIYIQFKHKNYDSILSKLSYFLFSYFLDILDWVNG